MIRRTCERWSPSRGRRGKGTASQQAGVHGIGRPGTGLGAFELKDKGVAVELVLLDGITHYETERFVEPLRAAVPWIRSVWKNLRESALATDIFPDDP
jgi:hypothetical protein